MVRTIVACTLALALQGAALTAPLVHAHPDDHATDHHHGRAVHTHWSGHASSHRSSDSTALEADDHDRAVFVGAFVAMAASAFPSPGVTHAVFAPPVPVEQAAHRSVQVAHGHDPPLDGSLSPRAPPAFLS